MIDVIDISPTDEPNVFEGSLINNSHRKNLIQLNAMLRVYTFGVVSMLYMRDCCMGCMADGMVERHF
jgi:hypothetical protein